MKETEYVTINAKGQAVIPVSMRKALGISNGSKVMLSMNNNEIIIRPANKSISSLKGMLPKPEKALSCQEMDNYIKEVKS